MRVADLLDGLYLFLHFSHAELGTIAGYMTPHAARKGEEIFREGDPGHSMLILTRGCVSIFKEGGHGQRFLSTEGQGRVIGEMALLDEAPRSATCVADKDCEFFTFKKEGLERLASEHPLLAYRFMYALAQVLSLRLRKTSGMMAEILGDNS